MKKILLTGAGGFVGGSVIHGAGDVELHAVSRGAAPISRDGLVWHAMDILDASEAEKLMDRVKPDAFIHVAASADIDYCQAHQDIAWKLNAELPGTLARLCAEAGARLVYTSTDTVFDGARGRYVEEDAPHPVNFYGETKVAAERLVADCGGDYCIARVSLVMGLPVINAGNSFLSKMMATLKKGERVGVPQEEVRSPIDVITLGQALLELAQNNLQGIVHLAGNDVLNRLEMMQRLAQGLGFAEDLIFANDPTSIPGRAPRPRDVSLDNGKAQASLRTPMVGLEEGLELVLNTQAEIGQ